MVPDHQPVVTGLFSQMLSDATLIAAWNKVRSNDGSAGVDRVTVQTFEKNLMDRLCRLRKQVCAGKYHPQPLLQVRIKKEDGKFRSLGIPTVRDRLLQTAACMVLSPVLEREFEEESFAYRPGRSVQMAVSRITCLRDEGFLWVVDADIRSYFDEINHALMMQCVARHVSEPLFLKLIHQWLTVTVRLREGGMARIETGIPQGSPIAPLLANLYLDDLDEAIAGNRYKLVRFSDDFLILCRSKEEARQALLLAKSEAGKLRLTIHPEKTRITNFEQGFRFLGVDFKGGDICAAEPGSAPWLIPRNQPVRNVPRTTESIPSVPLHPQGTAYRGVNDLPATRIDQADREDRQEPAVPADQEISESSITAEMIGVDLEAQTGLLPLLRTMYLLEQGLRLTKTGGRLIVSCGTAVLSEVPVQKLDQLVIHGNSMVSTAALRALAENDIGVYFSDWHGQCWGALDAFSSHSSELKAMQYSKAGEASFLLAMARSIVTGKIANCRLVLRRYTRNHELADARLRDEEQENMQQAVARADTLDEVRGHEGMAARVYYSALSDLLPETWKFDKRTRQPPLDPVNVLLSYGYAALFANIKTLIRRRGLDPHVGNLHALRDGHAALASDLMEEFRPLLVDSTVLQLIF